MKHLTRGTVASLFLALASLAAFTGCKENTIINGNLLSGEDNINLNSFDTATIRSRTVYDDTLITSASVGNIFHGAGSVSDPEFGKTHAGIFFQVIPPISSFNFTGSGVVIDSAFLVLPYSGFAWGDTANSSQQLRYTVYQITQSFPRDSIYYSSSDRAVDRANPLGSVTISLDQLSRKVSLREGEVAAHLRIPLSQAFISRMLANAGQDPYSTFPKFLDFFKGFYVEPDTTMGNTVMPYFVLNGNDPYSRAGVVFHYGNSATVPNNDTLVANFYFDPTYTAHFNKISRNYSGSYAAGVLQSGTDSVLLIQNEPGLAADLVLPYIQSLPKGVINRAQLQITQVSYNTNDSRFFPPARIFPIGISESGAAYNISDRMPLTSTAPLEFIDGRARSVSIGGATITQYALNIPRELQSAITQGKNELHLRISGAQSFPGAYRLIAGGSSHSTRRVRILIAYSNL